MKHTCMLIVIGLVVLLCIYGYVPRSNSYEIMDVSAYCPCEVCCGVWAELGYKDGVRVTASGVPAEGLIIAAPPKYAFGTIMDVPGYGRASVEDRGGAIQGSKIDLLFGTHKDALRFGRQTLIVTVYERIEE